jgi:hypothetical protein
MGQSIKRVVRKVICRATVRKRCSIVLAASADVRPGASWLLVGQILRFSYPAARRKPVVCRHWQTPLGAYAEPMFCTPSNDITYHLLLERAPR